MPLCYRLSHVQQAEEMAFLLCQVREGINGGSHMYTCIRLGAGSLR